MQSRKILLLVAAGAIAGLGTFGLTQAMRDGPEVSQVATPTSEPPADAGSPPGPDRQDLQDPEALREEIPSDESAAGEAQSPTMVSKDEASESPPESLDSEGVVIRPPDFGSRERTPSSVFEQKYAGYVPADLAKAKIDVSGAFESAKKVVFDERHQAGLYDIVPIDPSRPLNLKATSKDPLFRVISPANSNEYHIVWLPFDQYPELYKLKDEYHWLIVNAR